MNNRKRIILATLLLIFVLGAWAVHGHLHRLSELDDPILIEDLPSNPSGNDSMSSLLLSKEEAMMLASEQIDVNAYNLSVAELKSISGENYFLIDVVNKSGPSFGIQLAINERSGEVLAYDPQNKELMSMTKFPVETPLALQQDWNGAFVPTEGSTATEEVLIELFQGDQNSFEFKVTYGPVKGVQLHEVAMIDGSKASYFSTDGYEISFLKDQDMLTIKERGENPWAEQGVVLQGRYRLKAE